MKVVVIGGVAVGATLSAKLRRLNEDVEIEIFEKTNYISYANCGLPYYLSKTIARDEELILQDKDFFAKRYNLKVNVNSEVVALNFEQKQITYVTKGQTPQVTSYDKLVIATGTSAIKLDFLENKKNVFNLKTVEHAQAISNYIANNKVKNAVILGSGFIGLEVSENLHKLGIKTTIVELSNQILAPFDPEMAFWGEKELKKNGVEIIKGLGAVDFDTKNIILTNKQKIPADLVISAVGVKPNTSFLAQTGLNMDERGYINVNEQFETNIKDVYAAGDIIKVVNKITKQHQVLQLANPANTQAVLLAQIINKSKVKYDGVVGVSIVRIMNTTLAQCGINEKTARQLKLNYQVINAHINNHAGYYPGSGLIHFKVLINPQSGQIYGAQATGNVEGIDKRIDLLALAIKFNIKIFELTTLETTYAPQFGSAKDPILILASIGQNIVNGTENLITYENLTPKHELLFVVEDSEVPLIKHEKIQNIPLNSLRENLHKLDKDKHYVVSCKVGARAHNAVQILLNNGFLASNLSGGYLSINQFNEMNNS